MPVTPTYPGVYIEEIPSGVRAITPAGTSTGAFIGYTPLGPVNTARRVGNLGDYTRQFGGLDRDSPISYAVQQFFLNGGAEAYIIRIARGVMTAGVTLQRTAGIDVLRVEARNPGKYGNLIRLDVDYDTTNPDDTFNLRVTRYVQGQAGIEVAESEQFRNLSVEFGSGMYAPDVIKTTSTVIGAQRPSSITNATFNERGWSLSGALSGLTFPLPPALTRIEGVLDHREPFSLTINPAAVTDLATLLTQVQTAITNAGLGTAGGANARLTAERADADGTVNAAGTHLLLTSRQRVAADPQQRNESSAVEITPTPASTGLHLGLAAGGRERSGAHLARPFPTGTVSGDLSTLLAATPATTVGGTLSVRIVDNTTSPAVDLLTATNVTVPANTRLTDVAGVLQIAIRAIANPAAQGATVRFDGTHLRAVTSAPSGRTPNATLVFAVVGGDALATTLRLTSGAGALVGPQAYSVGPGATFGSQSAATPGADGSLPTPNDFLGDRGLKTGIYALLDAREFNLVCIPETATGMNEAAASQVIQAALTLCEEKRAFMIVDPVPGKNLDTVAPWAAGLSSKNGAVFFPAVHVADPIGDFRPRKMPASGIVAGVFARTDREFGVWKAPAGIQATIRGTTGLDVVLNDDENGVLNPRGVNVLRELPIYGTVVWGSRTLVGDDQKASEWKYVPIRRLALMIEETLFRGTKWVVFEPNDEPLWSQIRTSVGAFMQSLFRRGAFEGKSAREAYFVKCDETTTTATDRQLGIVNIVVGFAPLKPAEFVILQIQQIPPDLPT